MTYEQLDARTDRQATRSDHTAADLARHAYDPFNRWDHDSHYGQGDTASSHLPSISLHDGGTGRSGSGASKRGDQSNGKPEGTKSESKEDSASRTAIEAEIHKLYGEMHSIDKELGTLQAELKEPAVTTGGKDAASKPTSTAESADAGKTSGTPADSGAVTKAATPISSDSAAPAKTGTATEAATTDANPEGATKPASQSSTTGDAATKPAASTAEVTTPTATKTATTGDAATKPAASTAEVTTPTAAKTATPSTAQAATTTDTATAPATAHTASSDSIEKWGSGDWKISNGGLTATSPDNNTEGAINIGYGSVAIPDNAKTYFEMKVSGAAIQTAFTTGIGTDPTNVSNVNEHDEGNTPKSGSNIIFGYNLVVANSGDWLADPQNNASWTKIHGDSDGIAAPNQWANGAVIGEAVNRVNNTIQFTLNGQNEGTYSIQDLKGETLYPIVSSWDKSGPQATVNGGSSAFAEAVPAGYTPLNNLA